MKVNIFLTFADDPTHERPCPGNPFGCEGCSLADVLMTFVGVLRSADNLVGIRFAVAEQDCSAGQS